MTDGRCSGSNARGNCADLLPECGRPGKSSNRHKPINCQKQDPFLDFPLDDYALEKKKTADYLYIDVNEDHVVLQRREKKSDLIKAENGEKNTGVICFIFLHKIFHSIN